MFFIVLVLLSLSGCGSEVLQDEHDDDYDDDVGEEGGEGGDDKKEEERMRDDEEERQNEEDEEKRMNETEQETEERNEMKSINTNDRQNESMKHDLGKPEEIARHRRKTSVDADVFETTGTHLAKLRNEIDDLKERYCCELTARCYQLKFNRTTDVDYQEVIRNFNESRNCATSARQYQTNRGSMENIGLVGNIDSM